MLGVFNEISIFQLVITQTPQFSACSSSCLAHSSPVVVLCLALWIIYLSTCRGHLCIFLELLYVAFSFFGTLVFKFPLPKQPQSPVFVSYTVKTVTFSLDSTFLCPTLESASRQKARVNVDLTTMYSLLSRIKTLWYLLSTSPK